MKAFKFTLVFFIILSDLVRLSSQESDTILTAKEVDLAIANSFSRFITGNATNSVGNFVAINIGENKVEYQPTFKLSPREYLTISASGGISNGLFNAIKNSSINGNVRFGAQIHFLDSANFSIPIRYYSEAKISYRKAIESIKNEYSLDSVKIIYKEAAINISTKLTKLRREILTITTQMNSPVSRSKADSLLYELKLREREQQFLEKDSIVVSKPVWRGRELKNIGNKRAQRLDSLESKSIPLTRFKVNWFTVGYELKNDVFKYFNPNLLFDEQISKRSLISHSLNLQFSAAKLEGGNFNSYYSTLNLKFLFKNNFEDLNEMTITDIISDTSTNGTIRKIEDNVSVLFGEIDKNVSAFQVDYNYYIFFGLRNNFALHINPVVEFAEKRKPLYDMELGLFISLPKKENQSVIVNTEFFYRSYDISNLRNESSSFLERNIIGLRFTLPLIFNSLTR